MAMMVGIDVHRSMRRTTAELSLVSGWLRLVESFAVWALWSTQPRNHNSNCNGAGLASNPAPKNRYHPFIKSCYATVTISMVV